MSAKGSDVKLRMSRSFGDFYLKQNAALPSDRQAVVAVPEVRVLERSERDAFAVLACDGIFDVMTNQEVVDFVQQQIGFDGAYSFSVSAQMSRGLMTCCTLVLSSRPPFLSDYYEHRGRGLRRPLGRVSPTRHRRQPLRCSGGFRDSIAVHHRHHHAWRSLQQQ